MSHLAIVAAVVILLRQVIRCGPAAGLGPGGASPAFELASGPGHPARRGRGESA